MGSYATQVLVQRLPADSVLAGQRRLRLAGRHSLADFGDLLVGEGLHTTGVDTAFLGCGYAFHLAFADEGAFDSAKAPMMDSSRLAMGESSPVKVRFSLMNSTLDAGGR